MKDPEKFLGQPYLTKRNMREVVMQNTEPDPTREATGRVVKINNSASVKAEFDKVYASVVWLDKNQR